MPAAAHQHLWRRRAKQCAVAAVARELELHQRARAVQRALQQGGHGGIPLGRLPVLGCKELLDVLQRATGAQQCVWGGSSADDGQQVAVALRVRATVPSWAAWLCNARRRQAAGVAARSLLTLSRISRDLTRSSFFSARRLAW